MEPSESVPSGKVAPSATTRRHRPSTSGEHRQKQKQKQLEEAERIERALEQLEKAKAKARAQREEYGKFLQWKVKMQRKEMKLREQEEQAQQKRMEEHLAQVLVEHRQMKQAYMAKFRAKPSSEVLPTPAPVEEPPTVESSIDDEELDFAYRKRLRSTRSGQRTSAAANDVDVVPPSEQPSVSFEARPSSEMEESGRDEPSEGQFAATAPAVLSLRDLMALVGERGNPSGPSPLSLPQLGGSQDGASKKLIQQRRARHRSATRLEGILKMFQKAQLRRDFAAGRLAEDPPPDFADSDDLLPLPSPGSAAAAEDTGTPSTRGSTVVFLTETDQKEWTPQKSTTSSTSTMRRIGRRGCYHHFRWNSELGTPSKLSGSLPPPSPQKLLHERVQVHTSLQNYLDHVERHTRVHKTGVVAVAKLQDRANFLPVI
eukprot:RCo005883